MSGSVVQTVQVIGRYWQTPDGSRRRIYIDEAAAWEALGWTFYFYGTGNLAGAFVNGEPISNCRGKNLLCGLRSAGIYYDCADGKFHWGGSYNRDFTRENVLALINTLKPAILTMAADIRRTIP